MLSPQDMTSTHEYDARAKVFYLLKKFSSITYIRHAVGLYRDFVDGYEKQLNTPSPNQKELEEYYKFTYLSILIDLEQGVEALRKGLGKGFAYRSLVAGGARIKDCLFGRTAYEWGIDHDPFFLALGIADYHDSVFAYGLAMGARETQRRLEALKCTVNLSFMHWLAFGKRNDGGERVFEHRTYESIFQNAKGVPTPEWPDWPAGRTYPAALTPCPDKNASQLGEVVSGEEITTDGIWEPWFFTGRVGCPNYLLKGEMAQQYQPEGTNDQEPVRWRLLWKDMRYLDGSIPAEEGDYLEKPAEAMAIKLKAMPGDICPRTGYWEAFVVEGKYHVMAGSPMPGPDYTHIGAVIWNFVSETDRTTDV